MNVRFTVGTLAAMLGIGWSVGSAHGAVQVVHSTIAGHPTSNVPGTVPGSVRFDRFDLPWRSPSGHHWMMLASTNRGAIEDDVLLRGSGLSSAVVLKEGDVASWMPGETINTIDWMFGLNDHGQWAITVNTSGGPDVGDEYLLRFNGSAYEIVAQEGQPVPALSGAGATYGLILDEAHILNDGRVGFRCINVNNVPTNQNVMLFLGDAIVAREGVTIPAGQALGGMQTWESFDFLTYRTSDDGSKYVVSGDLAGTTSGDGVMVVNNTVLIQEGQAMPGFTQPMVSGLSGHVEVFMMSNGDWYARGSNSGGQDWVVRNSVALATTGSPIFAGATEMWSDATPNVRTYNIHVGNNHGDFAIGGWTNHADINRNHVVVLNNQSVIAREGDVVDLNGNGVDDDDAFIASFDDDEAFLNDQPAFLCVVKLRNGAGTAIGEAFVRILLCTPEPADVTADCVTNIDDLLTIINAWGVCANPKICPADIDGNGVVDIDDLLLVINGWS